MMPKENNDLWIQWKNENLKYHGKKHSEEYAESDQMLSNSLDHIAIQKWLSNHLKAGAKPARRLLDLGCGTGRWFRVMQVTDFILGVDFSIEMLGKAKEKYGGGCYSNISLVQCDIFNLPLKRNQFDCVVSIGVLAEHTPLNDDLFREIGYILKPGGLFLFTAQKTGFVKLKVKITQMFWMILPKFFKDTHEFGIKTFNTRLDHNKRTIRGLAQLHGFSVQKIETKSLTKSNFYFVCAKKVFE